MLIYNAELLDVQDDNYKTLVFKTKKYDNALKENVTVSERVGISKECESFLQNYKKFIGQTVFVGVNAVKTKSGSIFLLTSTDVLNDSLQVFA